MGIIVFNGVSSRDVGIEVETFPEYQAPQREYEAVHVPGRNGDIIIDNGTYKNVNRPYKVSIATCNPRNPSAVLNYSQKMAGVAKWLHSASGYTRLEDSYDAGFYRMAYYSEEARFENLFNEAGRGTITFVCKPQRFYKSGDQIVEFTSNGTIQNGTVNIALPKIIVTTDNNAGSFTISGATISIAENAGTSIIIDSDLQDAYNSSGANKNSVITLDDGIFPLLYPGKNDVSIAGGVTKLEIIPRWWTI